MNQINRISPGFHTAFMGSFLLLNECSSIFKSVFWFFSSKSSRHRCVLLSSSKRLRKRFDSCYKRVTLHGNRRIGATVEK